MKNLVISLLLVAFSVLSASAQTGTVKGTITDKKTGETLIGVNVLAEDGSGTTTDIDGKYQVEIEAGKQKIKYSFIGYSGQQKQVTVQAGETVTLNVQLTTENKQLEQVVVTGSAYEKKLAEEVVTMDVIQPYLVENNNAADLSDAVNKVPGVSIIDGQATIRGGSGYAYGAGSRVQVLVDDMPLLTGDLQEVRWNFVPLEHVEQVEVIKGASSSLYGSGALNGVINIRTGYAYKEPRTKLNIYQGIYSNPRREELRWWDRVYHPFFSGAFFSHRQRFGNLDVVVGGNYHSENSYQKEGDDQRIRFNFKTRYKSKKVEGLSYGVNANGMYQQFGRFFLWKDGNEGAYQPLDGTASNDYYSYVNVDPHLTYFNSNGVKHMLRTRFYNVTRWKNGEEKEASTNTYYAKYQFQKHFDSDWTVSSGLVYTYNRFWSNLYKENLNNQLGAVYGQVEKKFNKLTLLGGVRYEVSALYQKIDSALIEKTIPMFRAGLNYQPAPATYLRASFGQGYRIPSAGERFIEANVTSQIAIYRNPDLRPESGWTAEVGVKQGFKIGDWTGYADLALFWIEFQDMIEFTFGVYGDNPNPLDNLGFQSKNISQARVAGYEVSTVGQGKIGDIPVRIFGGYTFNYPADIGVDTNQQNVDIFLQNLFSSISDADSLVNTESILKYRLRNVAKMDVEFDVGKFTIGGAIRHNGFMERIDGVFAIIPGVTEFREINNKGVTLFDARLAYHLNEKSTFNLIVKNIENEEYSLRPALLEAPRSWTLQYKLNF